MFKNIYYEPWKHKMHLWEIDENGNNVYQVLDHEIEYYVLDKTGKSPIKNIEGQSVIKRVARDKDSLKSLKDSGEILYESDLNEEVKFLHKRYQDRDLKVDLKKLNIANIDIEIQTEGTFPKASEALFPINLITVEMYGKNEIYTFGLAPYTGTQTNFKYIHCDSEKTLLKRFCKFLKLKNVDYFIGWNIGPDPSGFDIPYLYNRIQNLGLDISMSPLGKDIKKYNDEIQIPGIAILDMMALYKKYTYQNQSSYSLDNIANIELGIGKLQYEGSISDLWKNDWNKFVEYNVQDVLLVSEIDKKKKLVEVAVNFSTLTRTPIEKVFSTVAVVEGYILRYLHRESMVMDDRKPVNNLATIEGGLVESFPGFYKHLANFDGTSLYPTTIMQFNISPETKVKFPESEEGLIKTPIPGLYYKKDVVGVIPKIIKDIFDKRKFNKDLAAQYEISGDVELFDYYDSQQLIYKIFMNSAYGAFLEKSFHYYDLDNGSCITCVGRTVIKYMANNINEFLNVEFPKIAKKYYPNFVNNIKKTNKVVIIDTDSNYVWLDDIFQSCNTGLSFLEFSLDFEKRVFNDFLKKIMEDFASTYNTEPKLNFKREKIILKLYAQAKKKYACQIIANEKKIYDEPVTKITGIEINKSDLCKFSRKSIKGLFDLMFINDLPDKEMMLKYVRQAFIDFKKQNISDISSPKGVGDYEKYYVDMTKSLTDFLPSTPIFNRASIVYNHIIKELSLPYVEIATGSKMKYIYVNPNNKYKTNVVGYVGNWPKEFDKLFKIDYDVQFEKQYLQIAQRLFDILGFSLITLKESRLSKLMED